MLNFLVFLSLIMAVQSIVATHNVSTKEAKKPKKQEQTVALAKCSIVQPRLVVVIFNSNERNGSNGNGYS
jgi:Na+-transporting methylmalonyl-CoA/oxaloacetate decarboxylase gamma subunit